MEKLSDRYYPQGMPSKAPAPSDIADKFMLRLPDGMRDRIADAAKTNNRSMNAEIVARLEQSFSDQPQFQLLDPKFIDRIEDIYEMLSVETELTAKMKAHLDRKFGPIDE